MPSGYTAGIYENADVSLKNYAMKCARAMGALAHMRDEPSDAEIDEVPEGDYYKNRLAEEIADYENFKNLTDDEIAVIVQENYTNAKRRLEAGLKRDAALLANYNKMMQKVLAWDAPTELASLKEFMIEQLDTSIKFDCSIEYYENELKHLKVEAVSEYKEFVKSDHERAIAMYEEQVEAEEKTRKEKNDWIRALKAAF